MAQRQKKSQWDISMIKTEYTKMLANKETPTEQFKGNIEGAHS